MSEATMAYALLLPFIFILHNIEEYMAFDKINDAYYRVIGNKVHSTVFLIAITFLSVLVSLVVILNYMTPNGYLESLTIIASFAIFINGLQHCISSLIFRRILPGALTSIFFIIPYSSIFIYKLYNDIPFQFVNFIIYMAISTVALFVMIFVSLLFGFFLNQAIKIK